MELPSKLVGFLSFNLDFILQSWITYLGLAQKGTPQGGSIVEQNGTNNYDKKIAAIWEEMNKGVPKRTFKTKPSLSVNTTVQTKTNVRFPHLFFLPWK